MFKISSVETRTERRLVLEGKLADPWTTEVEKAWKNAAGQLQGRNLVVDLRGVTFISAEGETILLKLMRDGAKFSCGDVLTRYVLRRISRRSRCMTQL